MTKRIDLRAPVELQTSRRLKRLETSDFGGYTSVNEGTFRVASDEGLLVEGSERITGRWYLDGQGQVRGLLQIGGLGEDGVTTQGSLLAVGVVQFDGKFSTYGETRFEGEQLFVGPTKVEGPLEVIGETKFVGPLDIQGETTISGEVGISGPVGISGNVDVSGEFKSTGDVFLNGTTRINGSAFITNNLTISGATRVVQSFKTEGPTELGGTVTIAGATTLNSTLTMGGGSAINAGGVSIVNNQIQVSVGGRTTTLSGAGLAATVGTFQSLGTRQLVMDEITNVSSIDGLRWLAITSGGTTVAVPQSVGGPLGDLEWPFDESQITDEFGPRESPGGIGSTYHYGMDFGAPEGTPIKAAGSGTIHEVGTGVVGGTGFGNYVVIQHSGGKRTLYAHMQSAPAWSVGQGIAKGAIVGPLGNTGSSTGPHLHLEVHVLDDGGYMRVNPRDVIKKPWS